MIINIVPHLTLVKVVEYLLTLSLPTQQPALRQNGQNNYVPPPVSNYGNGAPPPGTLDADGEYNCAQPLQNNCDFYEKCLETKYQCGAEGYPVGYGGRFCRLFQKLQPDLSGPGQQWITDTMICLQRELIPEATGRRKSNCKRIAKKALDSHVKCYVQNGFCDIKEDYEKIGALIKDNTVETRKSKWDGRLFLSKVGMGCVVRGVRQKAGNAWQELRQGRFMNGGTINQPGAAQGPVVPPVRPRRFH